MINKLFLTAIISILVLSMFASSVSAWSDKKELKQEYKEVKQDLKQDYKDAKYCIKHSCDCDKKQDLKELKHDYKMEKKELKLDYKDAKFDLKNRNCHSNFCW